VFYLVIDVWNHKTWAQPFVWIGSNAIALYLLKIVMPLDRIANRLAGGHVKNFMETTIGTGFGELLVLLVYLLLVFGVARFLYQRKIFFKV
jgi:predicted acyltransferase